MTTTIDVVVEHGLLRPLQPLGLPDGTRAEVTVTTQAAERTRALSPDQVAAVVDEIAGLSDPAAEAQPFSGRDHDRLLYGEDGAA